MGSPLGLQVGLKSAPQLAGLAVGLPADRCPAQEFPWLADWPLDKLRRSRLLPINPKLSLLTGISTDLAFAAPANAANLRRHDFPASTLTLPTRSRRKSYQVSPRHKEPQKRKRHNPA